MSLNTYLGHQKDMKQVRIEQKKREEEAQQVKKYNIENKEKHYQASLALIKEKKYDEAKQLMQKVISVDEEYKDAKAQIELINDNVIKIKSERELAEAKQNILQAKKLSKSNSCYDLTQAISKSQQALRVLPNSKEAQTYLLEAQINKLRCAEGNSELEMSIQILSYSPLKLNVWIKNKSKEVRYANPNYFTLVTVSDRSFSVSSETYGLSRYFDAVDLQPGTETSGAIIFDTSAKPKKLVYDEMMGTKISREFPFK
jgi:tetratricopeptide (TPR) repeat protein